MNIVRTQLAGLRSRLLGAIWALLAFLGPYPAQAQTAPAEQLARKAQLESALLEQQVSREDIVGVDAQGVPIVCQGPVFVPNKQFSSKVSQTVDLPDGMDGFEVIPGVIRDDGVEAFRIEYFANRPVNRVYIDGPISPIVTTPGGAPIELLDDGVGEDRIQGDGVYTSGLFRRDTSHEILSFRYDTSKPDLPGLKFVSLPFIQVEEADGSTTQNLLPPEIGLLGSTIPERTPESVSASLQITDHLINIRAEDFNSALLERSVGGDLDSPLSSLRQEYGDSFDFLMNITTNRLEFLDRTHFNNFFAGVHYARRRNYAGISPGAPFGTGRLLGQSFLDYQSRGLIINTAAHEILHQWGNFLPLELGITGEGAHYSHSSSIGSGLGGYRWVPQSDGSFLVDCEEGRRGGTTAAPLDRYLMGLIDPSQVPEILLHSPDSPARCGPSATPVLPEEITRTVTIEEIRAAVGPRVPGPAGAQRKFQIGFVAESRDRFLTPTEMTFYDILAEHFAAPVPPGDPDPKVKGGWVPVERYFGENTEWTSRLPRRLDANLASDVGVYRGGRWILDANGSRQYEPGIDLDFNLGFPGAQHFVGDWNGDGRANAGVYNQGFWFLDYDGNGHWDGGIADKVFAMGFPGAIPFVGDWNGDGKTKVGVYNQGFWFLDFNGNRVWEGPSTDRQYAFGFEGAKPLVGDWNGDGRDKVGVYSRGFWFLDFDGDTLWDGGSVDKVFPFGWEGTTPVMGDWNGDGRTKAGFWINGFWYMDFDGSYAWDGGIVDTAFGWGSSASTPVAGDWNGDGRDKAGAFLNGQWVLDVDGDGQWDGGTVDRLVDWGDAGAGDQPVPARW